MTDTLRKFWLVWTMLACLPAFAHAADTFQEGVQYQRLPTPMATSTPGKIEVIEFFWYGCPHCYRLESDVNAWLKNKPDNVEFVRIPAVLGRSWELGARAYYTAEALGVLDKIHEPLLNAIHAQKRAIRNEDQLADFFAEEGIDKEQFHKAFKSFEVETSLRRSQQLVRKYAIDGVPTLVVNGKYETNATMAGSEDKIFDVINYLIRKEEGQG